MAIWSLAGDQRISDGGALDTRVQDVQDMGTGGVPRLPALDVGTLWGGRLPCCPGFSVALFTAEGLYSLPWTLDPSPPTKKEAYLKPRPSRDFLWTLPCQEHNWAYSWTCRAPETGSRDMAHPRTHGWRHTQHPVL